SLTLLERFLHQLTLGLGKV
ncbi:unnamed protein product, partial [Allacma fusca]